MAKHLNNAAKRVAAILGVLVCALGGLNASVVAQPLVDPTRPPSTGAEQSAEAGSMPVGPVLQSILVSPRRAEAIINGRTVRVGDKVGDAKVVRITDSEVHLREGKNLQALRLYPTIEKKSNSNRIGAK